MGGPRWKRAAEPAAPRPPPAGTSPRADASYRTALHRSYALSPLNRPRGLLLRMEFPCVVHWRPETL